MSESRNTPKLPFCDVEIGAALKPDYPRVGTVAPDCAVSMAIRGMRAYLPECVTKLLENVSKETTSRVIVANDNLVAGVFDNGKLVGCGNIMPNIVDVKVIRKDEKPRVVIVTFADGTKEKAVLDENDTYSLEQGISICITKKLLGKDTAYGSSLYNKVIKHAMNVMTENEKAAKEAKIAEQKEKEKAIKLAEKDRKRKEKRAASKREYEIGIQQEAYVRAMKQLQAENRAETEKNIDELGSLLDELLKECEEEAANESVEQEKTEQIEESVVQTVSEMNESNE